MPKHTSGDNNSNMMNNNKHLSNVLLTTKSVQSTINGDNHQFMIVIVVRNSQCQQLKTAHDDNMAQIITIYIYIIVTFSYFNCPVWLLLLLLLRHNCRYECNIHICECVCRNECYNRHVRMHININMFSMCNCITNNIFSQSVFGQVKKRKEINTCR